MVNSIPIVIIVIAVVLLVVALLVWRMQKEGKLEIIKKEKAFLAQSITGIVIALLAAIFMFDGDVLGENTAGISTVIGIVGICLIATSSIHLLSLKRR